MSDLKTRTLASQYATSPTIVQMVDNFSQQITPAGDFANFISYVWDLDTAQGFGLDILGRIVQLDRQVTGVPPIYGFPTAPGGLYTMNDDQYRRALKVKALANISNGSALDINAQLRELSAGRGNAFVENFDTMIIKYNFYYAPEPYEYALITQYKVIGVPVGVGVTPDDLTINPYFGFSEADSWQPFDRGVFASY
jgi:hypothetical protein